VALTPHETQFAVVFLVAFIAGAGITAGVMWAFRDRIRAWMLRRRARD
jgi:hypothetical protein